MRLVLLSTIILSLTACSGLRNPTTKPSAQLSTHEVWRAFREQGDKPGLGIELKFHDGKVRGIYYIMDIFNPSDFKRGRAVPMRTVSADAKRIVFAVELPGIISQKDNKEWQFAIRFDEPLSGNFRRASMEWSKTFEVPLEFRLVSSKKQ